MTLSAENAGHNLANLSTAERAAIQKFHAECLERHNESKNRSSYLFSLLKSKPRIWIERELMARPDIEAATRKKLNELIRGKK